MSPVYCPLDFRQVFIMSVKINNPASYEVQSVIQLLSTRGHNAAEIHRQLCKTYESTAVGQEKVR